MKGFKSRKEVESIKEQYPVGTRIELIQMEDPYAPVESGMQGTVKIVDDAGTLHMKWDNGRTLGIVPGEDQFKVISKPTEETMDNDQMSLHGEMILKSKQRMLLNQQYTVAYMHSLKNYTAMIATQLIKERLGRIEMVAADTSGYV